MLRDLHRALDQEPEDDGRPWKPAIGDEIIGRLVRRDQTANKFEPDIPTERLVVQGDDGEHRTIYCNHVVLRNKILNLNPAAGDRIAIRRLADDPEKRFARYKVVVERVADQVPSEPDDSISF